MKKKQSAHNQNTKISYNVIKIGIDIVWAAVYSLSISMISLIHTFIRLFSDIFQKRPQHKVAEPNNNHRVIERRKKSEGPRNRRTCLPGLREALKEAQVTTPDKVLDSYYSVCSELALPHAKSLSGKVTVTEKVFNGYAGKKDTVVCYKICSVTMVRQPIVQIL